MGAAPPPPAAECGDFSLTGMPLSAKLNLALTLLAVALLTSLANLFCSRRFSPPVGARGYGHRRLVEASLEEAFE